MNETSIQFDETIVAQASAAGNAVRGILRLSGPKSVQSIQSIFEPVFHGATDSRIVDGSLFPWGQRQPVPATLFFWPQGHGYTGEESLEIHTVGSPPVLDATIAAICRSENVRLAKPGEFTMRAFLAGRIDLTQSEAVLGVIEATNDKSLSAALDQLAGGVATPLKMLREELFDMLARLEAGFDFADEDIEFVSDSEVRRLLDTATEHAGSIRRKMTGRRLIGTKPKIVVLGPPNAGKTTLFNRLLGEERGIVSPMPGTTRDYLEADWTVDGISCVLVDTAGICPQTVDDVDVAAQELSTTVAADADLIVFCCEEGTEPDAVDQRRIDEEPQRFFLLRTKGKTTLDEIHREIATRLRATCFSCDVVASTAARCGESLERAGRSLENARNLLDSAVDEALVASEVRVALDALGEIVGEVHTEDLLDRIFSRFCIGK